MKGIIFLIGSLLMTAGMVGLIISIFKFSITFGIWSLLAMVVGYGMWVMVDDHSDDQML